MVVKVEPSREYMTVEQMAKFLSVSPTTIHRWRQGVGVPDPLPSIRVTRRKILFDVAAVRGWLDEIHGEEWEEE